MRLWSLGLVACLPLLAQPAGQFVPLRGLPGFEKPEELLTQLAAKKGGKAEVNHFCVLGYRDKSGYTFGWVYWQEGSALIVWDPSALPHPPLWLSRRYLDLRRDVVATEDQIRGSTYLVTQGWVEGVKSDCSKIGDRYVIQGHPAKSKSDDRR
jgi:hypothetical protein